MPEWALESSWARVIRLILTRTAIHTTAGAPDTGADIAVDTTAAVDIIAAADTIEAEVATGAVVAASGAAQAHEDLAAARAVVELAVVEDVGRQSAAKVVD